MHRLITASLDKQHGEYPSRDRLQKEWSHEMRENLSSHIDFQGSFPKL